MMSLSADLLRAADDEVLAHFDRHHQLHTLATPSGDLYYCSYHLDTCQEGLAVYLHGFKHNLYAFANLIPRLGLPAIAIDLRGHGHSARLQQPYVLMADYLYDLKQIMIRLPDCPKVIIGHSLGGRLALTWAAIYPETVASLGLIDCFYQFYPDYHPVRHLRLWLDQMDQLPPKQPSMKLETLHAFLRHQTPDLSPEFTTYLVQHSCHLTAPDALPTLHWDRNHQRLNPMPFSDDLMAAVVHQLDQIELPILVFQSKTSAQRYHPLATANPNLQVMGLEGGHQLHWEYPITIAEAMQEWILRQVKPKAEFPGRP